MENSQMPQSAVDLLKLAGTHLGHLAQPNFVNLNANPLRRPPVEKTFFNSYRILSKIKGNWLRFFHACIFSKKNIH